jgi:hypothetical protein
MNPYPEDSLLDWTANKVTFPNGAVQNGILAGEGCRVFVDGKRIERSFTRVNTGLDGFAESLRLDENGRPLLKAGAVQLDTLYGHVEFVYAVKSEEENENEQTSDNHPSEDGE